jgi:hypothetical protein
MNLQETTLVFKLGEDNNLSDLKITSEIKHFIADLRGVTTEVAENIKDKFIIFANSISKMNGTIVPTLQEAYDYIEMDEMERQLEL